MHYHLEIIMPPTGDVQKAVNEILAPFDEGLPNDNDEKSSHCFWDFHVIGGRWAGAKVKAACDPEKLKEFYERLTEMKITVSGLTMGKQELQPASQIPAVDALWNELFPLSTVKVCPIFRHFNDQYKNSEGWPDIMKLEEMPEGLSASHVIIAGPHWDSEKVGAFKAEYMIQDSVYNGVNHIDTGWDGTVKSAIEMHLKRTESYTDQYREKYTPKPDWLVVTVDYHS